MQPLRRNCWWTDWPPNRQQQSNKPLPSSKGPIIKMYFTVSIIWKPRVRPLKDVHRTGLVERRRCCCGRSAESVDQSCYHHPTWNKKMFSISTSPSIQQEIRSSMTSPTISCSTQSFRSKIWFTKDCWWTLKILSLDTKQQKICSDIKLSHCITTVVFFFKVGESYCPSNKIEYSAKCYQFTVVSLQLEYSL